VNVRAPLYVIHYKGNRDRRQYLDGAFVKAGIHAEWVTAHDAGEFDLPSYYVFDPHHFRSMIETIKEVMCGYTLGIDPRMTNTPWINCVEEIRRQNLTLGEIEQLAPWIAPTSRSVAEVSLFLKHIATWEKIAASDADFAVVAEDDIVFTDNSVPYLEALLASLPEDFDYIDLVGGGPLLRPRLGNGVVNSYFFAIEPPRDRTTCCAVIRKRFARSLIDIRPKICLPVDWTLTWVFTRLHSKVYWVDPPVFGHGSAQQVYRSSVR
jgi:hypothetical protein